MTTRHYRICGDTLTVTYDRVWQSPSDGRQHASAESAMRSEVREYLFACGERVDQINLATIGRWID